MLFRSDGILEHEGFVRKTIDIGKNKKKVIKEIHAICRQLTTILQTLEDDSELVVQYPWPTMSYRMAKIIKKQAKKKRIKTILTIHDVNSIRTASSITRLYYQMLVREIDFMDSFDCIICHTPAMKRYLIKEGIDEKKVVVLEIFDYLVEGGENVKCWYRQNPICQYCGQFIPRQDRIHLQTAGIKL